MLDINTKSNINIESLRIDGVSTGIVIGGASTLINIINCYLFNFTNAIFKFLVPVGTGETIIFTGNYFDSCTAGISMIGVNDSAILNNYFKDGVAAILLNTAQRIQISNNIIVDSTGIPIDITVTNPVIVGNIINSVTVTGNAFGMRLNGSGGMILNNVLTDVNATGTGTGISLINLDSSIVGHNVVLTTTDIGIVVETASTGVIVIGNNVSGNTTGISASTATQQSHNIT
ncbi:unnamed protein product [marine sediment metagenome]|uniref:Right handed beta helix domain-containing protein n=1 Tax=marine sediment metagenome TaxID=412755 RepID=X0XBC3_9ZZZZ